MNIPRSALALLLLGLAACSQTDTLSTAEITARDGAGTSLPLTPTELRLRRDARSLLSGAEVRAKTAEADAYAEALLGAELGSGAARYAKLMTDIAADGARIEAFLAAADAVLAAERAQAGEADLAGSLARTIRSNENRRLVRRVRARLDERLDLYRQALGQLVLAEPDPQAIAAEEAITDLAWRLRRLAAG